MSIAKSADNPDALDDDPDAFVNEFLFNGNPRDCQLKDERAGDRLSNKHPQNHAQKGEGEKGRGNKQSVKQVSTVVLPSTNSVDPMTPPTPPTLHTPTAAYGADDPIKHKTETSFGAIDPSTALVSEIPECLLCPLT